MLIFKLYRTMKSLWNFFLSVDLLLILSNFSKREQKVRRFLENCIIYFFKFIFWFRYRITVKGVENLTSASLPKKGGVLFLPNHPAVFVDPILVTISVWKKYPIRPIIVEYMYYAPLIHSLMRFMNALPMPNNEVSSNSLKRKRSEKTLHEVIKGLEQKQNFLVYPAGRLKSTSQEIVGGASGVHQILQGAPDTNVVLVRTTGLWGSSFSRAFTGKTPPIFPTIFQGIKFALKNFLFFLPRREITLEFLPAPADFPYQAPRLELNRYLEIWYNRPRGTNVVGGENLNLVSYSFWKEEFLEFKQRQIASEETEKIDLSRIPDNVKEKVIAQLAAMTEYPEASIKPSMSISSDLGLDSLDTADLVIFLEEEFNVKAVPVKELTSVAKVMALASKLIIYAEEEEDVGNFSAWHQTIPKERAFLSEGKTIPEVFLNTCTRYGKRMACGDLRTGIWSYSTFKLRVILLADHIKKLPGDHIGILLPASVGATALILACQLAGKVPVMVNWTVGPRHLDSVIKLSGIKVILSSWAFIDRLVNVDLTHIDDLLLMLEDVRREITLKDKLKALWRSKLSTKSLMKRFGIDKTTENDRAVLIFTSGTESLPKGVPLSHKNILSNHRSTCNTIELYSNDVVFGILPPFHSFGLTVCSLLGHLIGIRVAYFPDPTDGNAIAKGVERWAATIICGAPTFLKKMLSAATPNQLKTLRYIVTGAEKAPPELFHLVKQMELGDILLEGYGITECSPVLTSNRPGKPSRGVGQPLPDIELCIVNPDTYDILSQGKQGLILARGPNVFSGYLNPGQTSPFLTVNGKEWYQTGDLGYLDEAGNLFISGRLKRFIKIGPEMISLSSIEEALLQLAPQKGWTLAEEGPSIAVCAQEFPDERPKIFVFTKFSTTAEEINQALKEAGFSNLVRISSVQILENIPIMGTGKVHYRDLEAKYLSRS